ncbi:tetratricopeptide repeat protein [Alteribacillus sp. HJP-4]|uniref:tetratricopeptide repeat protein n=1 Tax=Alteribacillus sp. HJP-4 TaxID=2775394 RepID=UPI0035CD0F45
MSQLDKALDLLKEGKYEESNKLMVALAEQSPDNAYLHYQCACSFDRIGLEAEAVPHYERAILLGLTEKDLSEAYVGLGSTYRTLGEYDKAYEVLQTGLRQFPDRHAIRVFYSMTLYNLQNHQEAMKELLNCLLDTTTDHQLLNYKRAIRFYSDKLDQQWKGSE